ncbi:DoxX family protein [Lawsonella clevelandensis]|uniref:DoxX family protein n=1 Tax=Lawsonella clevelandensis TaxID=1528099 RepID=UPI0032D92345
MSDKTQKIAVYALGAFMTFAGVSHMSFSREEFQAQVPNWIPFFSKDAVVLGSGVAEIGLGLGLLALPKKRREVGMALAAFYTAIFPGNIAQYAERRSAFGLDTDRKRFIRLLLQAPSSPQPYTPQGSPPKTRNYPPTTNNHNSGLAAAIGKAIVGGTTTTVLYS